MRKHKSNFPLVNEFYEMNDMFDKLTSAERSVNWNRQKEIMDNYPITITNFNKTKRHLLELNKFDFIIYASSVFCKKENWLDIVIALQEKLTKASFGNITITSSYRGNPNFTSKELMKLISLRNHENFDNILMLAENGQMDIVNSLTL